MKPKQIARPDLKSAQQLAPMQLNDLKFTDTHTVLTPELLRTRPAPKS